jgi:hypothetical protein
MKSFLHRHLDIGVKGGKTGKNMADFSCDPHSPVHPVRPEPLKSSRSTSSGIASLLLLAIGAFSIGALAVGALALGRLIIGKMFIRSARIESLEIGKLNVQSCDCGGEQNPGGACCGK